MQVADSYAWPPQVMMEGPPGGGLEDRGEAFPGAEARGSTSWACGVFVLPLGHAAPLSAGVASSGAAFFFLNFS